MAFYDSSKVYGFNAVSADLDAIIQKILDDEVLGKLLYYTTEDALSRPALTTEQKEEILTKEFITGIPRMRVDKDNFLKNYIFVGFDYFTPNGNNPHYMDSTLMVDVVCHLDNWKVIDKKGQLAYRPYLMSERLNAMIDEKKFNGIGLVHLINAKSIILTTNPDYAGLTLQYSFINDRKQ